MPFDLKTSVVLEKKKAPSMRCIKVVVFFPNSNSADTPTEESAAHTTGNGVASEVRRSHEHVSEM